MAPASRNLNVFDSLVDIAEIAQGGFFLRKKPLGAVHSVESRIENVVAASTAAGI
jgi:hypothetical protein